MAKAIDFNSLPPDSHLFLAEGSSEVGLVGAIVNQLKIERAVTFDVKGERNLKTVLGALAESVESGISLRCLGIVFDANADAAVKLGSIAAALTNAGFDFNAAALDSHGIYGGGAMPIGVFISPGGGASGRIETMILREISDTPAQPCIETFAKCVDLAEARRLDEKGLVQVYLGSFSAAHGVAVAFEKALFDIRHTTYDAVREMVRQLTQ